MKDLLFPRSKHHTALPPPDALPIQLQEHDQGKGSERDGGLDAQRPRRAEPLHPFDLDIGRHEARPVAARRDPRADLARSLRVAVQQIGVDGRGDHHDAEALRGREDGNHHVVPLALEREAQDDEAQAEDERGRVRDDQPGFRVETAGMTPRVEAADHVVQEVPGQPSQQHSNHPEKIEVAWSDVQLVSWTGKIHHQLT